MTIKQYLKKICNLAKYKAEKSDTIISLLLYSTKQTRTKTEEEFIKKVIQPLFWRYLKERALADIWKKSNELSIEQWGFATLDNARPNEFFNQTVSWGGCRSKFGIDWQKHHDAWTVMLRKAMLTEYHKILEDKTKKKKNQKA